MEIYYILKIIIQQYIKGDLKEAQNGYLKIKIN